MALSHHAKTLAAKGLILSQPLQKNLRYCATSSGHRCVLALAWMLAVVLVSGPAAWSSEPTTARIIVKWKPGEARQRSQAMSGLRTAFRQSTGVDLHTRRSLSDRLEVMELQRPVPGAEFAQALAKLRAQSEVEYAVPDEHRQISTLPNDEYITASSGRTEGQWYLLNNPTQYPAAIDAVDAWDRSLGGGSTSGVIVAVVDTGVRFDHPDLAGKLLPGYDFVSCDQANCTGAGQTFLTANDGDGWDAYASDPGDWVSSADLQNHADIFPADRCTAESSSWHGTRVAGIIGAATNNALGVAGAGWNARILPVRALGKCGGYDSDIIAGMLWAAGQQIPGVPGNANPAKVINLSLGGDGPCSQAYSDAITTLTAMNVSVVVSAGNDSAIINTPANCSGVISVVGVRNTGTKVGFSSLGNAIIAAPAGNCGTGASCQYSLNTTTNLGTLDNTLSCPTTANPNAKCYTTPGTNSYTDQTNANLGTSFSAPIVSGTIALMLGVNSNLTPAQIISSLRSSATPFPQTAAFACQVPTGNMVITGVNDRECNCSTSTCGAGLVNAYQAVLAVGAGSSSSSSSVSSSSSSSVSTSGTTVAPAASSGGGGATRWPELLWLSALLIFFATQRHGVTRISRRHCAISAEA
jgi:serine protease